jgi:hypothetical protein
VRTTSERSAAHRRALPHEFGRFGDDRALHRRVNRSRRHSPPIGKGFVYHGLRFARRRLGPRRNPRFVRRRRCRHAGVAQVKNTKCNSIGTCAIYSNSGDGTGILGKNTGEGEGSGVEALPASTPIRASTGIRQDTPTASSAFRSMMTASSHTAKRARDFPRLLIPGTAVPSMATISA